MNWYNTVATFKVEESVGMEGEALHEVFED